MTTNAYPSEQADDEIDRVRIVPPTRTFSERATVAIGRSVELSYHGFAHTDNDIVVTVPDGGVAFFGDLIEEGAPPNFGDSHPVAWPLTLRLASEALPSTIVPGHGDVATTLEEMQHRLARDRHYLNDLEILSTNLARKIWQKVLELRLQTGEPYLIFSDTVNRQMAPHQRELGLSVKQSNLCAEIMLHTGRDHLGVDRTAVCCLSSVNAETADVVIYRIGDRSMAAALLTEGFRLWARYGWVGPLFWYAIRDRGPTSWHTTCGLARSNWSQTERLPPCVTSH